MTNKEELWACDKCDRNIGATNMVEAMRLGNSVV